MGRCNLPEVAWYGYIIPVKLFCVLADNDATWEELDDGPADAA